MLFCCFWHNVETSCHKHFVVVSSDQQTTPLTTSDKYHNLPRSGGAVLITPGGRSVASSTRWSQILVGYRDFCLPHLHSTPPLGGSLSEYSHDVWYEKLEWCDYPTVKKIENMFIRFDRQNVWTWQTDRRTPHDGIGRACIASRCKKHIIRVSRCHHYFEIILFKKSRGKYREKSATRSQVIPTRGSHSMFNIAHMSLQLRTK